MKVVEEERFSLVPSLDDLPVRNLLNNKIVDCT